MTSRRRFPLALSSLLALAGCAAPAQLASAPAAPDPPIAQPPAPPEVVTTAAVVRSDGPPEARCVPGDDDGDACFATEEYRAWLCDRSGPGSAIALFRKGSPWTRAYIARDLESWDPSRAHAKRTQLSLDEEVVVLHANKPSGDVMVVGATNAAGWSSVDAVRADGTCVSLMADEITMKRPPSPRHAPVAWDRVDDATRASWLSFADVKKKAEIVKSACAKETGAACTKAKARLTDAMVAHEAP